jgi:membrane-bound lytic murein transglycosylase C
MKKFILLSLAALLVTASYGQSPYGNSVAKAKAKMATSVKAAQKSLHNQKEAFDASQARMLEKYNTYCRNLMQKWGDADFIQSTNKSWVDYSQENDSRSIVDFENGDVTVEVLADVDASPEQIDEQLELAIGELLENKGTTPVYDMEETSTEAGSEGVVMAVAKSDPKVETVSQKPILEDQLDLSKFADAKTNDKIAEAIVKEEPKVVKKVETQSGQKQVVSVRMKLVEDHIPKRAEGFKDFIANHASVHGVDQPLVYAVIEQESSFNPMARSSAGAYGLMQIIPKSGGRDANGYVNNRDVSPQPHELYDPDFNIQLGVGYLKKQMKVYFKGVRDKKAAMLCAIAAYNTGQGNVYYALTGKKSSSGVADFVNSMSYEQLYEYLKVHLPHAETRDYIQKVTSKMQKYTE